MIAVRKLSDELDELNNKRANIMQSMQDSPIRCQREQATVISNAQQAFQALTEDKRRKIMEAIGATRGKVDALIDSFTELSETGPVGKHNLSELEEHLCQVYPPDLIKDYQCLNPIPYSSEEEVEYDYSHAEVGVLNLRRGNFSAVVFNGLSALLDKAADYPKLGGRVAGGLAIFFLLGIFLSPFVFMTSFVLLGALSAAQGARVQGLLRRIYSVKLYLSDEYDEESFLQEKQELMDLVNVYLEEAQDKALDLLHGIVFEMDDSVGPAIAKKYNDEMLQLQESLTQVDREIGAKSAQMEKLIERIDALTEQEKKRSEGARKHYLSTIDWKKEWLGRIFMDLSPEGKAIMMEYPQGNSIYYSKELDKLKGLSRLVVFQSMLHMHPDFASNIVIDYKYNGGDLTQFSNIPDRCCKLCYSDADRTSEMENITNKIRARTTKILGSCESIVEYNQLMESFGTTGEYYVLVHVFGIENLSSQFLSNIRNGPRVGFFFKFYWTYKELQEFKDEVPLSDMVSIMEVTDNPTPRRPVALKRVMEGGA